MNDLEWHAKRFSFHSVSNIESSKIYRGSSVMMRAKFQRDHIGGSLKN